MMLIGAMAGYSLTLQTGSPWIGLIAGLIAGGLLSIAHAVVTIHFKADQVVSAFHLLF